jgi:hypothetical protein
MYIVISMPNRKSTACGVSHFIKYPQESVSNGGLRSAATTHPVLRHRKGKRDHHETHLMIFMSRAGLHQTPMSAANIESTDEAAHST